MKKTVTVWFDGDCPLCRREIALMQRLDKQQAIDFVNIGQSSDHDCPKNRTEMLARFHAAENDQLLSGAAAFAAMWRAIPLTRPMGLMARNKLILGVLERLYTVFLKFRPMLLSFMRKT